MEHASSRSQKPTSNGLSVLVNPDEPSLDVVFVHGFKGDPGLTWTHKTARFIGNQSKDSKKEIERPAKIPRLSSIPSPFANIVDNKNICWPKHLVPQNLPTARVLSYGYDTKIRHPLGSPVNQATVYDIAWDLLLTLEYERRPDPSRPILFVAHSLGGIVVKEMLRRSSGHEKHHPHLHQIHKSTTAIIFFGTPHGGADPRGFLGHVAEQVARAAGFRINEQIVNTLLPTSERLRELRDEFGPMARQEKWTIYSFQEQYGVQFLGGKKERDLHDLPTSQEMLILLRLWKTGHLA